MNILDTSSFYVCEECGAECARVVEIGGSPLAEQSEVTYICQECLLKALTLIRR